MSNIIKLDNDNFLDVSSIRVGDNGDKLLTETIPMYSKKYVGTTRIDLNNTSVSEAWVWDYAGAQYVFCGDEPFGVSAGVCYTLLNLGGVFQVFVGHYTPSIKVRCSYRGSWSEWREI